VAHQPAAPRPFRPRTRDDPVAPRHRAGSPPVRHTHPGEEIIYVLAGSLEYQIDGQPAKVYNAGEALTVPAGIVHAVRNAGTGTGTALATDVVEKGKPLLTVAQ
jgi:quercetin dioxygenase-like cupin family protein